MHKQLHIMALIKKNAHQNAREAQAFKNAREAQAFKNAREA